MTDPVQTLRELLACKNHIYQRNPDTGNITAKQIRDHERRWERAWADARTVVLVADNNDLPDDGPPVPTSVMRRIAGKSP